MLGRYFMAALLALATFAAPTWGRATIDYDDISDGGTDTARLPGYLQCVPYARAVSGVQIFGDAYTWWDQAEGRYARGHDPKVGAVMAFRPFGNMRLGHVAAVSRIVDARTVLLRHANWSPIGGRRGQIENDVQAVDVSPANDWSQVRVWFAPIHALGGTAWPVEGFIYNRKPGLFGSGTVKLVKAEPFKQRPEEDDQPVVTKSNARMAMADPIGDIIARRGR